MRINFDRLSQLAGLPASRNSKSLNESADYDAHEGAHHGHNDDIAEKYLAELEANEGEPPLYEEDEEDKKHEDEKLDEMIEIDEVMLVQELRRAKRIMQESKKRQRLAESRNSRRRQSIQEAQLKRVIDEEVRNVMNDLNLTSGWVYGDNRPKRSRNGYTHQGSYIKGIGFK